MWNPLTRPASRKRLLVGLFIILQADLVFVRRHDTLDLNVGPNTQPTELIYQENRVGQTFIAKNDNLARIDIALGTYGRENSGTVFFRLWEETPERRLLREKAFSAASVKNDLFHTLRFKIVHGSLGKRYYFVLSSADSTYQNSISVWMNRHDIYPEGRYFFRHQPQDGDLMFRVYSRQTVAAGMGRIVRKYRGLLGNRLFAAAVMLFFAVVLTLVFAKLLDLISGTRPAGTG